MSKKAAKGKTSAKKSAPKKAKKVESEEVVVKDAPAAAVKMEPAPTPYVLSRFDGDMHERRAKGFSMGELGSVGMNRTLSLSLDVSIDLRRRSTLEANVDVLKAWYKPAPKKPAAPRTEKAEKPAKSAKAEKKSAAKKPKKE